jgi:hypothetical protein
MTAVDLVVVGSPYRLHGSFDKNITGATITVHYTPPSPGIPGTWTGTVENGPTGGFYCDVTAAENAEAGEWTAWAEAILGGIVIAKTFGARYTVAVEGYVP